jgi:Ca2+-transporting ATPase
VCVCVLSPENKCAGVAYTKGAAEIIIERATHYVNAAGKDVPLDSVTRQAVLDAVARMARNALRAVALSHKFMKTITPDMDSDEFDTGLVLDAVFGIKDPLRTDVTDAVMRCQEAGIFVRMVTGDNVETAKVRREGGFTVCY